MATVTYIDGTTYEGVFYLEIPNAQISLIGERYWEITYLSDNNVTKKETNTSWMFDEMGKALKAVIVLQEIWKDGIEVGYILLNANMDVFFYCGEIEHEALPNP